MDTNYSKYEIKLFYLLLLLLVWLPMPLGSNRPWSAALFEVGVSSLAVLWLWGYQSNRLKLNEVFNRARPVLLLLSVWLVYVLMQLIPLPISVRQVLSPENVAMYQLAGVTGSAPLSLFPYATFQFWMKSVAYVAVFAMTLLLVNNKHRMVILAYAILFSALFQAFYGSIMTLSGLEYGFFIKKDFDLGTASGTYVNRNHFAGYLEMGSAIGIGLLLASSSTKVSGVTWRHQLRNFLHLILSPKMLLRLMLAMIVIALVLTRSRMGNTAFFSSMLVAGMITLTIFRLRTTSIKQMFQRTETRSAVLLLTSLMLIDLFIVGAWFGVDKVEERLSQTSVTNDADRLNVDLNTINIIKDYPLVGTGGGTFYTVFPRYRTEDVTNFFDHAHDDYLELMSDTGVIGISLLGLVVLLSVRVSINALYYRRDRLLRGMAFASVMGVTALLIHSAVDFNLQIPANAATFMVLLALGWISLHLDSHSVDHNED